MKESTPTGPRGSLRLRLIWRSGCAIEHKFDLHSQWAQRPMSTHTVKAIGPPADCGISPFLG